MVSFTFLRLNKIRVVCHSIIFLKKHTNSLGVQSKKSTIILVVSSFRTVKFKSVHFWIMLVAYLIHLITSLILFSLESADSSTRKSNFEYSSSLYPSLGSSLSHIHFFSCAMREFFFQGRHLSKYIVVEREIFFTITGFCILYSSSRGHTQGANPKRMETFMVPTLWPPTIQAGAIMPFKRGWALCYHATSTSTYTHRKKCASHGCCWYILMICQQHNNNKSLIYIFFILFFCETFC